MLETNDKDLTLAEAAKYLGITHGFLRQCCVAGRIKGRKMGHFWVVLQSECDRYANEQKGKMGPKGPRRR